MPIKRILLHRRMLKVASAFAAFALPFPLWADQWVMPVTPTQVISGNAVGAYIQIITAEAVVNPGTCNPDSYVVRDPTQLGAAAAIALSALAVGRQLRLYVSSACDAPTGGPLILSIGVI